MILFPYSPTKTKIPVTACYSALMQRVYLSHYSAFLLHAWLPSTFFDWIYRPACLGLFSIPSLVNVTILCPRLRVLSCVYLSFHRPVAVHFSAFCRGLWLLLCCFPQVFNKAFNETVQEYCAMSGSYQTRVNQPTQSCTCSVPHTEAVTTPCPRHKQHFPWLRTLRSPNVSSVAWKRGTPASAKAFNAN